MSQRPAFSLFGLLLCFTFAGSVVAAPARLYDIDVHESWITLADGVRLSAAVYMPKARSAHERFPAVL